MTKPFEERLRQLKESDPVRATLPEMTLAQYFEGIALLSGQVYPVWLYGKLCQLYRLSPNHTLRDMVNYSIKFQHTDREEGLELLYRLLIEPFLLCQKDPTILERGEPI